VIAALISFSPLFENEKSFCPTSSIQIRQEEFQLVSFTIEPLGIKLKI
jgi:hypothetical protein